MDEHSFRLECLKLAPPWSKSADEVVSVAKQFSDFVIDDQVQDVPVSPKPDKTLRPGSLTANLSKIS